MKKIHSLSIFNANEIKANGVSSARDQYVNVQTKNVIHTFLSAHLSLHSIEDIVEKLATESDMPLHVGSRTKSIDSIMDRITSALAEYGISKYTADTKKELISEWLEYHIDNISAMDLSTIVESAILDCASADHWYTFEKEW